MKHPIGYSGVIDEIFKKPGNTWNLEERMLIFTWMYEDQQLHYLLLFCLWHLGSLATPEDAEDAWGEFTLQKLDRVIVSYNPTKGRRFWNFLLLCLERFCWIRAQHLEMEEKNKESFGKLGESDDGNSNLVITPELISPLATRKSLETQVELEEFTDSLERGIQFLSKNLREAFLLICVDEVKYAEAAAILCQRESTIRVWVFRAKEHLRKYFEAEGWSLCSQKD